MRPVRLFFAIVIASVLTVAPQSSAYEVHKHPGTGAEARWATLPVTFNVAKALRPTNITIDGFRAAIQASYKTWTQVSCTKLTTKDDGLVESFDPNAYDNAKTTHSFWKEWDAYFNEAAAKTPLKIAADGKLIEADVVYNANYAWSFNGDRTALDIQAAATHEIGHSIGINHTPVTEATMFTDLWDGELTVRSLASDDIAGLCHLYPSGGALVLGCSGNGKGQCVTNETCMSGSCVLAAPGYGDKCNATVGCGVNACINWGVDFGDLCTYSCSSSADCVNGDPCEAVAGSQTGAKACHPYRRTYGTKALGNSCDAGDDCISGACVVVGSGKICTAGCNRLDQSCPSGYHCDTGKQRGFCLPGVASPGVDSGIVQHNDQGSVTLTDGGVQLPRFDDAGNVIPPADGSPTVSGDGSGTSNGGCSMMAGKTISPRDLNWTAIVLLAASFFLARRRRAPTSHGEL